MEQVYDILKSFVDPIFIIFVLLFIAFLATLVSAKKKGGALFLFFILILLYGLSIPAVSNFLSYKLEKKYILGLYTEDQTPLDVIAVFSGGAHEIKAVNASFPIDATMARLVHAVRMFKAYHAKYLACMGKGLGKISNAELMAEMAQDLGVPKERIRVDTRSKNTYEHAIELNRMFVDKNMRVGLVTSAYHMQRSEKVVKKFFPNVRPLPSSYLYQSPSGTAAVRYIPQSQSLFCNTLIFREYVGQIWYSIKDI
jgi:uncharacterized SAM-binding protein YcdF (DUF218 family)